MHGTQPTGTREWRNGRQAVVGAAIPAILSAFGTLAFLWLTLESPLFAPGLAVFALFTGLLAMRVHAARATRIALGPSGLRLAVPASPYWPVLALRDLAPAEIARVETAQEVARVKSRRRLTEIGRLVLANGSTITFAESRDEALPVTEIADAIAAATGAERAELGARRKRIPFGADKERQPWEGRRVQPDELRFLSGF